MTRVPEPPHKFSLVYTTLESAWYHSDDRLSVLVSCSAVAASVIDYSS